MKEIFYKSGYKYQLMRDFEMRINIIPSYGEEIKTEYLSLYTNGLLKIKKGYCWDGPSGPTIDTNNFMRGALIHDALYQLIRMRHLRMDQRINADQELYNICIEDGMSRIRATYVYWAVRLFGKSSALSKNIKQIKRAGKGS